MVREVREVREVGAASVLRIETEQHYERAVGRVIAAMHEHLDEEFPLEDMAAVAYMSPFHLNRVFRGVTGVPPCRFLTALRLATAKRLLATCSESITEVSLEVGYNSLGTFTRRFTELVGVAPSRFRLLAQTEFLAASLARQCELRGGRSANLASTQTQPPALEGQLVAPADFDGVTFIGAFSTAIPQSRPVACAVLTEAGPFRLVGLPDGDYHVVAAGLSWSEQSESFLLYEESLRGELTPSPFPVRQGRGAAEARLWLHPPRPFDPPILMTFPALLTAGVPS